MKNEKIRKSIVRDLKVSDESIRIFSYKGAFILMITSLLATTFVPWLISQLGVDKKLSLVIGCSLGGSLGISYVRNFIDNKNGYGKKFIIQFIFFAIVFGVISYFWTYYNYYI